MLGLFDERTDLFQAFQIPNSTRQEQSKDEVDVVGEAFAPLLLITHEVYHHIRFIVAHRDGDIALVNDTQRDRGIGRT